MPSMADIKNDLIYAMFKGEPGTRKSSQAASFPTPQYWFSHDKKMQSLIRPMKDFGVDTSRVDYDDYKDWMTSEAKMKSFMTGCPYKTLIFDSITSGGDSVNLQTMALKSGTNTKEGEAKGYSIGGIPVSTLEDYKAEAAAFARLIAMTKDIHVAYKVNIVLIAHVIGARDNAKLGPDAPTHFARIIVTGGQIISAKIPAYCTEVYHFNVGKPLSPDSPPPYGLYTVHSGSDFARTSLPLPPHITFNDEPIYEKYLLPAIKKQEAQKPVSTFPTK